MSLPADLTGKRFGRLVAVCSANTTAQGRMWWFMCDCGARVLRLGKRVKFSTQSCGCLTRDASSARCSKMNRTHGQTDSPTWVSWKCMLERCNNPKATKFKYYGACGIAVCARWLVFENFLADMGERPAAKTLDRWPDPAGGYEPGNCRWATALEQRHNRREAAHIKTVALLKKLDRWPL